MNDFITSIYKKKLSEMSGDHVKVFEKVYETCDWGNNQKSGYKGSSGCGSSIDFNIDTYVPFLQSFIKTNKISSISDLGCGDFICGKLIYGGLYDIQYNGYDAYGKLIEAHQQEYINNKNYTFTQLDIFAQRDCIASADLCIIKDVLQHWCLDDIYTFMDFIVNSKKFKFILICNCCNQTSDDTDIKTGGGRPLSCSFMPLLKYNPVKVLNYKSKEVSIIDCSV